jgi:hypothetical protein
LYKPRDGQLWCFNRPTIDTQYFKEIPNLQGPGTQLNNFTNTLEQRFVEEDEENDVDLEKTMWLIVRQKKSIN